MSNVENKNEVVNTELPVNDENTQVAPEIDKKKLEEDANNLSPEMLEFLTSKLKAQMKKKEDARKNKPSTQLEFATFIAQNKLYAAAEASAGSDNILFYAWQGNHWKNLSFQEGKKIAFKWLESLAPCEASDRNAGECFRTALLKANTLPKRGRATILPFLNKWITVSPKAEMTVANPDMNIGITYQICSHVKHTAESEPYVPALLPVTSKFYKFITSSLPDAQIRALVQEYLGYTFINDVRHQVAQVWQGDGLNGKSVLLKLIIHCHQKVASIRLDNMKKFGLINLLNASLAVSAETPKSGIDVEELKKCISGDLVSLEGKNKNEFDYAPFAKWIILCNSFPKLNDHTNGIWRRLQIISWDTVIAKENIIENLDEQIIEEELDLFMDWCLEGLQRLIKRGSFDIPESVAVASNHERVLNDTVLQFKDASFVVETGENFPNSKLKVFESYLAFCEEQHMIAVGSNEFWKRMKSLFKGMKDKRGTDAKRTRIVNIGFDPTAYADPDYDADSIVEVQNIDWTMNINTIARTDFVGKQKLVTSFKELSSSADRFTFDYESDDNEKAVKAIKYDGKKIGEFIYTLSTVGGDSRVELKLNKAFEQYEEALSSFGKSDLSQLVITKMEAESKFDAEIVEQVMKATPHKTNSKPTKAPTLKFSLKR